MAAPQQPQQHQQPPAQLGDAQTPGFSVADPTQSLGSQVSLSGVAPPALTDQGVPSPSAHHNDVAAENGQPDLTPQHGAPPHHAVSSATSISVDSTDQFGNSSLSAEERDRLATEWKANGKPSCPDCKKKHPSPCDTARVYELACIRALKDEDLEAYQAQMAAFEAKYPKKQGTPSTQKRKASSSDAIEMLDSGAPAAKKGKTEQRKKHSRRLTFPFCNSCQTFHLWGQHTKTKQEAQDLLNRQAQGLAPIPQLAAVQAFHNEVREIKAANANRGRLSGQQAQANLDRRVADIRDREIASIPDQFCQLMQQQGPEAGYNYLVGLYNGTEKRYPAQLLYPMPAYGYAAPTFATPTYATPTYATPSYATPEMAQDFETANLRRGQRSTEKLIAQCDRRRAEQSGGEQALIAQVPLMISALVQQQPQAGFNYMVGMYYSNLAPISLFPRYDTPAYQHPALTQGAPAPIYPATAFPSAQHYLPQAAETQDNAPRPTMPYPGTAYSVPPGTRHVSRRDEVFEEGEVLD